MVEAFLGVFAALATGSFLVAVEAELLTLVVVFFKG